MKRDKTDKTDKGVKPADDNNIIDKSEINDEIVSYLENIRPRRRLLGIDPEEFWIVISNIQKIYALQLDEQDEYIRKMLNDMNELLKQNTRLMQLCNDLRFSS